LLDSRAYLRTHPFSLLSLTLLAAAPSTTRRLSRYRHSLGLLGGGRIGSREELLEMLRKHRELYLRVRFLGIADGKQAGEWQN
jgi:hypothetical protein